MGYNLLGLDFETNGQETYGRFCNPLDLNNTQHKIICSCLIFTDPTEQIIYTYEYSGLSRDNIFTNIFSNPMPRLVGQNIKFDLLWCWNDPALQQAFKANLCVWDTKYAEYLLHGQDYTLRYSLNELSKRYGGVLKDTRISDHLAAGKMISELDS